eukprot:59457-Chlamydomonas_euryale.AAC.1
MAQEQSQAVVLTRDRKYAADDSAEAHKKVRRCPRRVAHGHNDGGDVIEEVQRGGLLARRRELLSAAHVL